MMNVPTTVKRTKRMQELVSKWLASGIPSEEDFAPLTPDQARTVAYDAGYNTCQELHTTIRDAVAALAKGNTNDTTTNL